MLKHWGENWGEEKEIGGVGVSVLIGERPPNTQWQHDIHAPSTSPSAILSLSIKGCKEAHLLRDPAWTRFVA